MNITAICRAASVSVLLLKEAGWVEICPRSLQALSGGCVMEDRPRDLAMEPDAFAARMCVATYSSSAAGDVHARCYELLYVEPAAVLAFKTLDRDRLRAAAAELEDRSRHPGAPSVHRLRAAAVELLAEVSP